MSDVVVYNSGEIELKVSIDNETIWLTQKQIAEVFDVNVPAISKHIKNIYKDNELDEFSTVSKMEIVQKEGTREVARIVDHYSLDIILAVGYRTNSAKAIRFRQWTNSVLKDYIINGYAVNKEKITQQRILNLESDIKDIKSHIKNNSLELKQGIFFNGQIFDAHTFILEIIKSAKTSITLIDNYIDSSTLTMLSNNQTATILLISHTVSKQLKLDIEKYNKQYKPLKIVADRTYHDRYIIIDSNKVYSIGASLKDAGNKTFNINLMSDFCEDDIVKNK
ncbi:MAG: virulence RhuM family protein [Aliarcobacter sp.]|jgi:prophage antirepressor-like protein|nr:virulence RhuM family protein [Aliarcobacter sp.]MBP7251309.1 virulence RhuM family protein [Aliarcobacter sp.]